MFDQYDLPDEYARDIEQIIGRLTLLYGQIDRLLIHAITQKTNPKLDIITAIGIVRNNGGGVGITLGRWKKWLELDASQYGIPQSWIDSTKVYIDQIENLRNRIIHDTLMQSKNGDLEWKTNQNRNLQDRPHALFDIKELQEALAKFYEFKSFLIQ